MVSCVLCSRQSPRMVCGRATACRWLDGQPVTLISPEELGFPDVTLPSRGCLVVGQRATGCTNTDSTDPDQLAFTGFDATSRFRRASFIRVVLFEQELQPEDLPCLLQDCTADTCGVDIAPIHSWGASEWVVDVGGVEPSVVTDMGWRSKDLQVPPHFQATYPLPVPMPHPTLSLFLCLPLSLSLCLPVPFSLSHTHTHTPWLSLMHQCLPSE